MDTLRYQGDVKEGGTLAQRKVLRPKYLLITILVSTVWKSFKLLLQEVEPRLPRPRFPCGLTQ